MIDSLQLRHEIIRPVLLHLDDEIPYTMAAENLLMGTCAQESKMGQFLVQLNNGPARGIFQMEPATESDIWANFLGYRKPLSSLVSELCISKGDGTPSVFDLIGNLYYEAAMCRVHYRRAPEALPDEDDVQGMADLWKLRYNTPLGAGTVEEFMDNYKRYVA